MTQKTLLTLFALALMLLGAPTSHAATCFGLTVTHPGGGPDNDYLVGGSGGDVIRGYKGDDTLEGKAGSDCLCGNDGEDTLYGNNGNDYLRGGNHSDYLSGGDGNDYLDGTYGYWDVINGGAGSDTCENWNSGTC